MLVLPRRVAPAVLAGHVALALAVEHLVDYGSFDHGASPRRAVVALAAGSGGGRGLAAERGSALVPVWFVKLLTFTILLHSFE